MTNQTTPTNEQGPERIWMLKSVIALFGTSDFVIPEEFRPNAIEYIRADLARPVAPVGELISRDEAVSILKNAVALADPVGVIPPTDPEHSRLAALRDSLDSAALAIAALPARVSPSVGDAAKCTWSFHADACKCVWNKTACGINDAAFGEEDRFRFCPYCGKAIQRVGPTVEEVMDNE